MSDRNRKVIRLFDADKLIAFLLLCGFSVSYLAHNVNLDLLICSH
jgi:hypothetical protein